MVSVFYYLLFAVLFYSLSSYKKWHSKSVLRHAVTIVIKSIDKIRWRITWDRLGNVSFQLVRQSLRVLHRLPVHKSNLFPPAQSLSLISLRKLYSSFLQIHLFSTDLDTRAMKTRQQSKPKKDEKLVKPSKGKQKVKASGLKISESKAQRAQSATDRKVYIRVQYSDVIVDNTDLDPSAPRHLYLIEGNLDDIARHAGDTIDWIIRVSNLICDPSGKGHIYTHTQGTPSYWYDKDRDAGWREVTPGDPLLAGIYEFLANDHITLSKICERDTHSVTSRGAATIQADTFRRNLEQRDVACMVTRNKNSLITSCPETCRRRRG